MCSRLLVVTIADVLRWPGLPEVPPRLLMLSGVPGGAILSACFFCARGKGPSAVRCKTLSCAAFFSVSSDGQSTIRACWQHHFHHVQVDLRFSGVKKGVANLFPAYFTYPQFQRTLRAWLRTDGEGGLLLGWSFLVRKILVW